MAIRVEQEEASAPAELVAQCEDFNRGWLSTLKCEAVPYFQTGEFGDEWKIRVQLNPRANEGKSQILCEHLQPDKVSGHTLYLLARACFDAEERGREAGVSQTLLKLFQQQCVDAGIGKSLKAIHLEREINGCVVVSSSKNK